MKETELLQISNQFRKTLIILIRNSRDLSDRESMIRAVESFIKTFNNMLRSWGVKSTLLYFKEVRLCFTKHLAGEPLSPKDLKYTIGLTKEGLPKVIGAFVPIVRRGITPNELRVLMTLLTIGRSFQVPPEVSSLDSITLANEECDQVIEDLGDDFEDFVKRFAKKHFGSPMVYDFQKFHLTLSYGPSGPALRSSLWEAQNLDPKFLKILDECSPGLSQRLDFLRSNADQFPEWVETFNLHRGDKFRFGKISKIPDKEGKTRVIALLNYWAQSALKPIHDEFSAKLKMIPYDCTHNQGNFRELVNIKCDDKWHSVDLKDATDRFPRKLQEIVVRCLMGPKAAKLWSFIMSQELDVSWEPGTKVKYAVGQPMGAYSSFPVFAMTHGLLISYLAELMEIEGYPYRILGDDIVIRNDVLAGKYIRVLNSLNVPISVTKTMQSVHTFEFAKRWFHKGVEVSPFPVNALHESLDSFPLLAETFRVAYEKGWHQNFCAGPGLVRRILLEHGKHKIFIKRYLARYELFTSFPRAELSEVENQRNWVKFLRLSGHYVSCVSWRNHCQETLNETLRLAAVGLLSNAIQSLAKQSDDLWRCLYYAGLSPSRGIKLDLQKVLEWANPVLAVLRQQATELDTLSAQMDKTNSANSSQIDIATFLRDYGVLRVFSLEQLKKERTHKMVLKARAKLVVKAHEILLKTAR